MTKIIDLEALRKAARDYWASIPVEATDGSPVSETGVSLHRRAADIFADLHAFAANEMNRDDVMPESLMDTIAAVVAGVIFSGIIEPGIDYEGMGKSPEEGMHEAVHFFLDMMSQHLHHDLKSRTSGETITMAVPFKEVAEA